MAAQVAGALGGTLDVFVVGKIGAPGREELAMGAVASGDVIVVNDEVVQALQVPDAVVAAAAAQRQLSARERAYREDRPPLSVEGRPVIVVDDGLATGSTMRAAITALRRLRPTSISVAVPTAPAQTLRSLQNEANEVVCARIPRPFIAVGHSYEDFTATTDKEVRHLLAASFIR